MCLGVPGRLIAFDDADATPLERSGRVDFGGVVRSVRLAFVPDAVPGDYVLVHAGIAIARIDEAAARATLALVDDLRVLDPGAP
jgi:hydrogenase expression/formation protein HypC